MDAKTLRVSSVNLELAKNHEQHRTQGLSSTSLVVRRGQPFCLTVSFSGFYRPNQDDLLLKVELDPASFVMNIPFSKDLPSSPSQWAAYFQQGLSETTSAPKAVVCVHTPANASVGGYNLQLLIGSSFGKNSYKLGQFALLCNPWSQNDTVFLSRENEREEYVRRDYGLLYQGTPKSMSARPWGYDQYEKGVLEACLKLLDVSNERRANWKNDYFNRSDPVYIGRVISAMINSNDDLGVLQGNWSDNFSGGIHPSKWSGSGEILRKWAQSGFKPVKYGQCWVFAAVMCTVMRVLGIPTRVVTNFNSAHDTNGNLVIEEFYSENGEKLPHSEDSIWNFHVWVESWMKRGDLGMGYDGWQVLDPTPQERSEGVFRCGPAPVKAVRERRIDLIYDIPFVFAEVNADVSVAIVYKGRVVDRFTETDRVGALVCTKALGSTQLQDITSTYKQSKAPQPSINSLNRMSTLSIASNSEPSQRLSVTLSLLKVPVVGENISFTVTITNKDNIVKNVKEHVNAQAKTYYGNPTSTFWEEHKDIRLAPYENKVVQHQISYKDYAALGAEQLVNLAVVIMDVASQERVLASEEFNFANPDISIEIANEDAIVVQSPQVALVTFTNPFSRPVSGTVTVAGAGLLEDKAVTNVDQLQPGNKMEIKVKFTPKMEGRKMLYASLWLNNISTVIRNFKTLTVRPAAN